MSGEDAPGADAPGVALHGDPKPALREAAWAALLAAGAGRFPGTRGRIPNFTGAERAAAELARTEAWAAARVVKINPDSPMLALRRRALLEGKTLVVAVPKLATEKPFLVLDPARLPPGALRQAATIPGAARWGVARAPADVPVIDLVVAGAVAVSPDGARLGKGGGYSDLELALLVEAGRMDPEVPVWTLVHPAQLVPPGSIPLEPHDVALDGYATPDGVVACARAHARPRGIVRASLTAEKVAAVPLLAGRGVRGAVG